MSNLLDGIEEVLLMGPGPSCVPPQVYEAIGKKTLGHLDPYFLEIMDELKERLRTLLNTKNNLTVPISGTGSAGMEACFVNLVEPGDRVLILINGVFGMRMREVASRLGAEVDALEFTWGTPVVVDDVAKKLKEKAYRIVAVVHAETSTGVRNPVAEIGALLKGTDTIYLVDTVTSLGGIEVRMDDWGIDALYSGTQKCLSCPPGLAPLSFSEKAMAKLGARKTKVPNWYLDISLIAAYWGQNRVYHHTAPVNMTYALYQALLLILEEGPEKVFKRHLDTHLLLVKGLEASPVPGAAADPGGGAGKGLPSSPRQPPAAREGARGDGPPDGRREALAAAHAQHGILPRGPRRAGRPALPARRAPDRDRRRAGAPGREDLAHRPDGPHGEKGERGALPRRPPQGHFMRSSLFRKGGGICISDEAGGGSLRPLFLTFLPSRPLTFCPHSGHAPPLAIHSCIFAENSLWLIFGTDLPSPGFQPQSTSGSVSR